MIVVRRALCALALLASASTANAGGLVVKDGAGVLRTMEENAAASGNLFPSVGLYLGSALVGTGNPLPVAIVSGGGGGGGTVAQGAAGSVTTPWYETPVQGGALIGATNGLYVQPGTGTAWSVTGTFWQATQPVSLAALPALPAGSSTIGSIANTSFGISGTLPAFAATPTVNVGTLPALPAGSATIGAVTQASGPWTINQTQIGGVAIAAGTGASNTGTQRVAVSTDSPGGASANPAYVSALNIATAWSEVVPANTTGILIATGAHVLYGLDGSNVGSAPLYVKIYDTATAPTCGSGTPKLRRMIPAASTNANGAGTNVPSLASGGASFTNGIGLCVTGGIADADATAPSASVGLLNLGYQ